MTPTTALLVLAWVAIVLLALALGGVVAQQRAFHAVVTGQPSPVDRVPVVGILLDRRGNEVDPPYAALFVTPGCASCKQVVPAVAETVSTREDGAVPVFIVSDQVYPSDAAEGGDSMTWLVDREGARAFRDTSISLACCGGHRWERHRPRRRSRPGRRKGTYQERISDSTQSKKGTIP